MKKTKILKLNIIIVFFIPVGMAGAGAVVGRACAGARPRAPGLQRSHHLQPKPGA